MKVSFVFAENIKWWAFLSPVIMKISKTNFSHSAILVEYNGNSRIYHSEWPKGYFQPLDEWSKIYAVKHQFTYEAKSFNEFHDMVKWLNDNVTRPYSILQLILILIHKTIPQSRKMVSGWIINGNYRDICTEFMASFMEEFFSVRFDKSDDLIDLNDVFEAAGALELEK
jgi:hypothetical protein